MTLPATLAARARAFADEALSENSRRAYRADWQHYARWCGGHDLAPLPAGPDQVASYLTSMAETHKRATIERRLVTIGQAHKLQGLPWIPAHPAVRAVAAATAHASLIRCKPPSASAMPVAPAAVVVRAAPSRVCRAAAAAASIFNA